MTQDETFCGTGRDRGDTSSGVPNKNKKRSGEGPSPSDGMFHRLRRYEFVEIRNPFRRRLTGTTRGGGVLKKNVKNEIQGLVDRVDTTRPVLPLVYTGIRCEHGSRTQRAQW